MRDTDPRTSDAVVVTGATGFVGHVALARLLDRGAACIALVRHPAQASMNRLRGLLAEAGCEADAHLASGQLTISACDLHGVIAPFADRNITTVVHCAASTRFEETADGELERVNVEGTRRLLHWCDEHAVPGFVYVSTAYVCDRGVAVEGIGWSGPARNAYEASKRRAEEHVVAWAERVPGRTATILRPSIVVGESDTGRCTRFGGFYLAVRATQALASDLSEDGRTRDPLRLFGAAEDPLNIVPVDWVAAMIAGIATTPALHGCVYHLTHPEPPTNAMAQGAIERVLGIRGGRFAPIDASDADAMNGVERLFHSVQGPVRAYLLDPPDFERRNTETAERTLGLSCPVWTSQRLERLVAYPVAARWRRGVDHANGSDDIGAYFERFLPSRLALRALPGGETLNITVRFVIGDAPRGAWTCRFVDGRLVHVERNARRNDEAIRYDTTEEAFWSIVTGAESPQDVFLRGDADVSGSIEQALMLGTLLRRFNELHPYTAPAATLAEGAA